MAPEIKVAANLKSLLDQLDKVSDHAKKIKEELISGTKVVDEELDKQTKSVQNNFQKMASFSRRVGQQMKTDLKAMLGVNAVQSGLQLNNMFRNQISKVGTLNDAVRKLGASFGVNARDFAGFQAKMMSGLGQIGLSAEDAANTMQGLAGSGVKGAGNILEYSKIAGQLTSLGREKGNEGGVAKGLADVVRARGGNVQDVKQVDQVAAEVTRAMETTGYTATQILGKMKDTFEGTTKSGRGMVSLRGAAQSAIADQITGANVSGLIKSMTAMSPEMRQRSESMGLTKILGKNGELDIQGIKNFSKTIKSLGTSPDMAAHILGEGEEFGNAITRLIDQSDRLEQAFKENADASGDYVEKFKHNKGLKEAGEAVINRAISPLSEAFGKASQGLTDMLSKSSESTAGSIIAVGSGALLSAALAAGGARSVLGSLAGSVKGTALQSVDKDVQKVYVVNASEISGGGSIADKAGVAGLLRGTGSAIAGLVPPVAIAAAVGYGASKIGGAYIENKNEEFRSKMTPNDNANMTDGFNKMAAAMEKAMGKDKTSSRQDVNVTIQNKATQFETRSNVNRGKSQ